MHHDLVMPGPFKRSAQTIDSFDIVAIARVPALYSNATDHAVAIMRTCQDACYSADHEPEWLAGYRILTRAIVYLSARRWPGVGVNVLTIAECGE